LEGDRCKMGAGKIQQIARVKKDNLVGQRGSEWVKARGFLGVDSTWGRKSNGNGCSRQE